MCSAGMCTMYVLCRHVIYVLCRHVIYVLCRHVIYVLCRHVIYVLCRHVYYVCTLQACDLCALQACDLCALQACDLCALQACDLSFAISFTKLMSQLLSLWSMLSTAATSVLKRIKGDFVHYMFGVYVCVRGWLFQIQVDPDILDSCEDASGEELCLCGKAFLSTAGMWVCMSFPIWQNIID